MIGCGFAGAIQSNSNKTINPNIYFAVYTALIAIMFVAVLFLNRNLEPEVVLIARQSGENSNQNVCKNLQETITTIYKTMKHPEVHFSLLYFII